MLSFDFELDDLADLVAIPSVSRDASARTMNEAAGWLAGRLSFAGGRVVPTGGHPVVRADWLGAPDAPTVLVYGHYDVQPTGDLTEWRTRPFELVRDGEVIRGRGVTVATPALAGGEPRASVHARDGGVAGAGFSAGIPPLSAERRAAIAAVPFDDEAYRVGLGLDELFGEAGYGTLERLWERPT